MSQSWIATFCGQSCNKFYCRIPMDYIKDDFNFYGLRESVPCFEECLKTLRDETVPNSLCQLTPLLYGLIHARFIVTDAGLKLMAEKYTRREFGVCSRVKCRRAALLPMSDTHLPFVEDLKTFCFSCNEVYCVSSLPGKRPQDSSIIGPHFQPLFRMIYSHLLSSHASADAMSSIAERIPRIYGFQVCDEQLFQAARPTVCGPPRLFFERRTIDVAATQETNDNTVIVSTSESFVNIQNHVSVSVPCEANMTLSTLYPHQDVVLNAREIESIALKRSFEHDVQCEARVAYDGINNGDSLVAQFKMSLNTSDILLSKRQATQQQTNGNRVMQALDGALEKLRLTPGPVLQVNKSELFDLLMFLKLSQLKETRDLSSTTDSIKKRKLNQSHFPFHK